MHTQTSAARISISHFSTSSLSLLRPSQKHRHSRGLFTSDMLPWTQVGPRTAGFINANGNHSRSPVTSLDLWRWGQKDEVRQKKERNSRLTGGWRINQKNKDLTGRTGKRWGEKTGLDEIQEADLCGRVRKPPLIKMCQQGKVQREYPTNRAP